MGKKGLIFVLLLSGCSQAVSGDYCDIAFPLYFESGQVVDYLAENDENLLKGVVIHNETGQDLCGWTTSPD